jgi:AraC-like DNA-binding protein
VGVEIVSTRQVGAADRLGYWNEVLASTYRGMVVDAQQPAFEAQLSTWRLGPLRMVRPRSSSAVVRRHETRATIGSQATIIAHIINEGQVQLTQRGRQVSLGSGDMVLCAGEEPYRFDCPSAHRLSVVEFDGAELAAALPQVEDCIAMRIPGQTAGARIFQSYLSALWAEAGQPFAGDMAQTHSQVLVELLGACLAEAETVAGAGAGSGAADPVLRRIREAIAARIGDFDLGPATIARECGIPLRTLQAAAARAGTTIGQMIGECRLARGAAMLRADPRKSVIEVAMACGFADPSYFARRFAQRFGQSPRDYRAMH